jgi:hypothetical protein
LFTSPLSAGVCGDADSNGQVDLLDVTYLVKYLYRGGPAPDEMETADVNRSGTINILDIAYIINYLYRGGLAPNCAGYYHQDSQSGCLSGKSPDLDSEYVVFEVVGNDLHTYHFNAMYNCCLKYEVSYIFEGVDIMIVESDTGPPCDCICLFDLESILYDLADGQYIVSLIDINGHIVAIDTIVVPQSLIEYHDGGCHNEGAPAKLSEEVNYIYSGDTLRLEHNDAQFNCGAKLMVEFHRAGDTLRFYELNISTDAMYCICSFDIFAAVVNIQPGAYVAEIYQQPFPWEPIGLYDRRVINLGN